MHRALLATLIACGVLVPAASAAVGPDYVSSDNVELVDRIKTVGDGVGGRVVGDYLYVTSTKSLSIFDIKTDPEHPKEIGLSTLDIEFENEEVPTNGKLLGISGQIGCADPLSGNVFEDGNLGSNSTGCLTLYDVSDPANVKKYGSVAGAGQHTSACVLDCKYMYGSTGAVTDTSDPAKAKLIGSWQDGIEAAKGEDFFKASCHHLREIQPGIILGSCQPIILFSINKKDGGSPLKPVVLATGTNQDERFIHSGRWPNGGTDKFLLIGGETNAEPVCNDTVGSFMVWDASKVGSAASANVGEQFKLLDEIRPINGNYADGHSPVNGLGCSVHWFQERPGFKNGGVVANAQYENGTRILQITPEGKIVEQGFFLPLGGSTSSPLWNPNGKVIYSVDYARGVDVLRYTGPSYVPDANGVPSTEPGSTPGTEGPGPGGDAAPCASAAGFKKTPTKPKGRGLRFAPTFRQQNPYDVDVFQQSEKRRVLGNRLRARFKGKKGAFTWKGSSKLTPGNYFVRYSMKLADGGRDVRRITFAYKRKHFKNVRDFYQRTDCGIFSRYKLGSSVFGGNTKAKLGISYRLARGADAVKVVVKAGKRTVKTFKGGGASGRTYRFSVPAKKVKRGKTVAVTATAQVGQTIKSQTLYAKRL
jgi:hypothetical protein